MTQPETFDPARFLAMLHAAYVVSTGQSHGGVQKFRELYRVLTYRPHIRRTYSEAAFAHDIYRLDRHGGLIVAGLQFRLHPGATAARDRRNLLVVTTRDGLERTYYGIEFIPKP